MQALRSNIAEKFEHNIALPEKAECSAKVYRLITMMMSREADRREEILFKQGRGQFHVSSAGHEALAVLADHIKCNDQLYCHYRDRALLLALGMSLYDMALGFFAKAESSSGGRQLVNHFSCKDLNVVSAATPCAIQCLPAVGSAWATKLEQRGDVTFCFLGDASTRQGEFFESLAFAIQESLPIIFVVEDNGYGISTSTENMNPASLGLIPEKYLTCLDAHNSSTLANSVGPLIANVRKGEGPKVLWLSMSRLASHTGSDDQSNYRSHTELVAIAQNDPLTIETQNCVNEGILSDMLVKGIEAGVQDFVKEIYELAEREPPPQESGAEQNIFSENQSEEKADTAQYSSLVARQDWTMLEAWNSSLDAILTENQKALIFGEDVEDPKGGVFGLTKGLSDKHQKRIINSPLAEATIAGLASGLAVSGYLPIFELQFADFIGPAFNQIVNQIATLRWRSNGHYKCPLILYAPCGSYISNGGPWHSQCNESWLAHSPGIKICMPSTPDDAASMLVKAAHGDDPVFFFLPKNLLFAKHRSNLKSSEDLRCRGSITRRTGSHITIVSWGNCVALSLEAADRMQGIGVSCEVIDLRTIVPCDWPSIHRSVRKTGRLVVVQEDNKTCSFGQAVISEICSDKDTWNSMFAPPELVSRADVLIGFSEVLERSVLPDVENIIHAANIVTGKSNE